MNMRRIRQLAAILAVGCVTPATANVRSETADVTFEQYEVVLGAARNQTVLPGFFLGGPIAELAVVHIDEAGHRRLRLYAFGDDTWVPRLEATLRRQVLFVDVASIGGRERLISYEPGRLNWFDPESSTERALVDVDASYRAVHDGEIPHVDITRDVNGDGRDDLILPAVDGFWVSTQSSTGAFADAVKLGPPEPFAQHLVGNLDVNESGLDDSTTYGDVGITAVTIPVYLSRVHEMDYNQDGRIDLVFWNEDHFEVHLQDEQGLFDPVAATFTTDVPFDSDGAYSRALDYTHKSLFSTLTGFGEKTERTVLHSLRDLNGDGVADLVTLTLAGRSITKQRSLYEVHFGAPTPDGTVFSREVGTAIRPRGKAGGMQPWGYASQRFEDVDDDGLIDVLFRDVVVGFGGMVRALVGKSVPINLELYRSEAGTYPREPTTVRKIRRFAPFAGMSNIFFPPVLMGDVNGDGRSDLLVGKSPQELHVFLGVTGPDLLARQPRRVAVTLPYDERNTRLVDLDRDRADDVLVHEKPTGDAPDAPHRVTLLIAR